MIRNILLTGATGFLGSHLLKVLLEKNYKVKILTRKQSKLSRLKELKGFSNFVTDEHSSNFSKLFEEFQPDAIIHLATEYGRDFSYSKVLETNVLMPVKLIEAADKEKLKLFINTDSFFSRYPDYKYLEDYIASKRIFLDYLKRHDWLKVSNLQLEHIYGEADSDSKFVTAIMKKLLANENEISFTAGTQKRDFTYVADVAEAYLKILENEKDLEQFTTFEIGTGNSLSVKEFVEKMHRISGSKSHLLFGKLQERPNEIRDSHADITEMIKIGWNVKFETDQALEKMISFEKLNIDSEKY